MSHIATKSGSSSQGDYSFFSRESSIILSLPHYVRCTVIFSLFVLGIGASFLTGRYYLPYQRVPTECQPNIDRESFLPLFSSSFRPLRSLVLPCNSVGFILNRHQCLCINIPLSSTRHLPKVVQPLTRHGSHCFHPKAGFSGTRQFLKSVPTLQYSTSCTALTKSGKHIGFCMMAA